MRLASTFLDPPTAVADLLVSRRSKRRVEGIAYFLRYLIVGPMFREVFPDLFSFSKCEDPGRGCSDAPSLRRFGPGKVQLRPHNVAHEALRTLGAHRNAVEDADLCAPRSVSGDPALVVLANLRISFALMPPTTVIVAIELAGQRYHRKIWLLFDWGSTHSYLVSISPSLDSEIIGQPHGQSRIPWKCMPPTPSLDSFEPEDLFKLLESMNLAPLLRPPNGPSN